MSESPRTKEARRGRPRGPSQRRQGNRPSHLPLRDTGEGGGGGGKGCITGMVALPVVGRCARLVKTIAKTTQVVQWRPHQTTLKMSLVSCLSWCSLVRPEIQKARNDLSLFKAFRKERFSLF